MRIITGAFGGRRFDPPLKDTRRTRPTTDRAKEGLFNILRHGRDLTGLRAADLFAGTGSVGFEFLSNEAASVDFVEQWKVCLQFIRETAERLGCTQRCRVIASEVSAFLRKAPEKPYDLIFADPPYDWEGLAGLPAKLLDAAWLSVPGGLLVVEHDDRHDFAGTTDFVEQRRYGEALFSFFEMP